LIISCFESYDTIPFRTYGDEMASAENSRRYDYESSIGSPMNIQEIYPGLGYPDSM